MTFTEEDEALFIDGGKREKKKEDNLYTAEDKLYLEKIIKENSGRFKEIGYEIAKFVTGIHNIYDVCIFVTFDDRSILLFYKNCQCKKENPKKETLWKVVLADGLHSFPKGTIITKHKIYLECFKNDPERWINMGTGRIQSTNIENINESGVYYHYGRVASKNETFEEMLWKELEKTPKMRKKMTTYRQHHGASKNPSAYGSTKNSERPSLAKNAERCGNPYAASSGSSRSVTRQRLKDRGKDVDEDVSGREARDIVQ
ncbi:hypothetical protein CAEBREN_02766 [Caenorhabditis brenneri]|uniref:Uncharacterized protein n=1 Tax=Caenorhabditis brenneri TaxID=135651 RepID=G0N813_CAEBE|nr:hypothetical protein CAEBREN_02766 [Caenorhabditis brenneri]